MRGQNKISFPARWNVAGSITSETAALAEMDNEAT
jgi:hypothetical protein